MSLSSTTFLCLFLALLLDRFLGDPDWLWRKFPHPVVLFGNAIAWADKRFNRPDLSETQREKNGFGVIAFLLISSIVFGWLLSSLLASLSFLGFIIEIIIVTVFLAQKSLADHVRMVANGLRDGGLAGGRKAVSMIVGRDPQTLDEAGVCRAAIESLAENASDGVVAPAFWYAIFGLPGLFAYKMLNTADSMVGHMNDKYRAFGRASAKFDDLANFVPARLTGFSIVLAGGLTNFADNFTIMIRDAKLHRSPNAGWPESAMAAVTGLALGGPRIYDGDVADEPFMHDVGRKNATWQDIGIALEVFWRAMTICVSIIGLYLAIFYGPFILPLFVN